MTARIVAVLVTFTALAGAGLALAASGTASTVHRASTHVTAAQENAGGSMAIVLGLSVLGVLLVAGGVIALVATRGDED